MTTRQRRVLFLPMDGRGLGHLSRASKLAEATQGLAACLIATGLRYAGNLVSDTCEYVRIPGLDGLLESRAAERGRRPFLDIPAHEGLAIRREFFSTIERTFRPDLIVTDLMPTGPYSELSAILAQSAARKLIVFRPVPGDEGIHAVVEELGLEALDRLYDSFLIASDSRIASVDEDMHFTERERSKCSYIGYVSIPVSRGEIETERLRRGLKAGDRWVVCSAGAGIYAQNLIEDCMGLARDFTGIYFDIVSGPSCLSLAPSTSPSLFFDGRVRISCERANLRMAHAAADVVICHGGYNTLTEAMEGGASLIVDVGNDAHRERRKHASRLQPYYPITIVEGAAELALGLRSTLSGKLERRPVRETTNLNFDGCREFRNVVSQQLELSAQRCSTPDSR